MSPGEIANLDWAACDKCQQCDENGNCIIGDSISIRIDMYSETVVCEFFEEIVKETSAKR